MEKGQDEEMKVNGVKEGKCWKEKKKMKNG